MKYLNHLTRFAVGSLLLGNLTLAGCCDTVKTSPLPSNTAAAPTETIDSRTTSFKFDSSGCFDGGDGILRVVQREYLVPGDLSLSALLITETEKRYACNSSEQSSDGLNSQDCYRLFMERGI